MVSLSFFGYGSDEDAWIVGQEGTVIWETGRYSISRSTGFPLHELIMAPLSVFGKWYACNSFSILCGIIVIVAMFAQHKIKAFRFPVLVFITLSFLPQVIINASSTLDYLPSMACWMLMYYFFLKEKYYLAAIIAGIACGFRPSNGAFIIPVVLVLLNIREYKKSILVFLTAFVTGIIAYSPVLINYGILDPTREVHIPFLQNLMIGIYQFLILFGVWQTILIGVLFILHSKKIISQFRTSKTILLHSTNILFWLAFFFGITSSEAEYLFPVIPSVIFLLDEIITQKQSLILCISLLSYNIVSLEILGGESGNRKFEVSMDAGYTIRDYRDRKFKLWFREAATNYKCGEKTLLMFGSAYILANNEAWEYAPGYSNIIKQKSGNLYISERIIDPVQLQTLSKEGIRMYVWNKRKWEYLRLNVPDWEKHVTVIDDLEKFLGEKAEGELDQ